MTAIVYRDGILAADTGVWAGDVLIGVYAQKIVRLADGSLIASAGSVDDITWFIEWAQEGFPVEGRPTDFDAFGALHVQVDGSVRKFGKKCRPYPAANQPWFIEGGYEDFLHGACANGATAAEAVYLAIQHCPYVGGSVQIMELAQPAEEPDLEDVIEGDGLDTIEGASAFVPGFADTADHHETWRQRMGLE